MKKYFSSFAVMFVFLAAFAGGGAFGQNAQQDSTAPRKADAQFHRDYQDAKKTNQEISNDTAQAAADLERKVKPKRIKLEGLTTELQAAMARRCADVPQGCHYDEALDSFIPNPKPAAAAPAPQAVTPAPTPAPGQQGTSAPGGEIAKPEEKK